MPVKLGDKDIWVDSSSLQVTLLIPEKSLMSLLQPQEREARGHMRTTSGRLLNWRKPVLFQIPDCQREADEERTVTDFVAVIKENNVVVSILSTIGDLSSYTVLQLLSSLPPPQDCSVARCGVFRCSRFMGRLETKTYNISANISSGWIEQVTDVHVSSCNMHFEVFYNWCSF